MQSAASLLRRRNFGLLFSGRCVSFLGNAMAPVALAFAVLHLTGSATALGIVLATLWIRVILILVPTAAVLFVPEVRNLRSRVDPVDALA